MERRAQLLITAVFASSGCTKSGAWLFPGAEAPDEIKYSHASHLDENVACLDCHGGVNVTRELADVERPDHAACARCHATQMDACTVCHTNPTRATKSRKLDRGLVFSHPQHMPRVNGNCVRCHFDIPRATSAEASRVPEMDACTDGCHREDLADTRCERCHVDLGRYRLESIRFLAHSTNFERRHQDAARANADSCAKCHERTFCTDCHADTNVLGAETKNIERPTRSFIHPAPYRAIHALDARAKRDTCESCHKSSFCSSCHASVGLAALDETRVRPHPSGWLDPTSPQFHGREARRSITTCASCHDRGAASVCVRCHQVGGTGGSPHPPNFSRRDAPADNRMCRLCHGRDL
jgi:hypothetical protein